MKTLLSLVLVVSCAPQAPRSAPTPLRGIDATGVNRAADPCTDFYAYANGAWRARNPVPAGKPRWGRRDVARELDQQKVRGLVEALAAKPDWPAGSAEELVSDLYASCMDEAAIDRAGSTPIAPLLADIDEVKTPADVQHVIRRLHDLGIPAAFGETGAFDNEEPAAYELAIVAGAAAPHHATDEVLALEKRLADATTGADPGATAHSLAFAELQQLTPHFDWTTYAAEARIPRGRVNVAEPKLLQQIDHELETTPVAVWKGYLTAQVLDAISPWFSKTEQPRAQRCVELTEALLGEALGRTYVAKYFPPAAKAKARDIANRLAAVMKHDLERVPWLAAATRQQALAKLATMSIELGYPDAWKDLSKLHLHRDALWANIAQARQLNVEDVRRQIGKPTDRHGWALPPSSAAAYIDLQLNELVLPAGFLQPPNFDLDATDAANYGAFGAGLAHDMTHAFDATGALLDAEGRARPWWTDADRAAFAQRTQCIVDQYEGYEIEPGVHHHGKQVLDEALGDQAGVHFAYVALQDAMAAHPAPTVDDFTPEQQFFLAWGQFRGEAMPIETQRKLVASDPHPMPKFRVIGPLSGSPEFARAFSCTPLPAQRCPVW